MNVLKCEVLRTTIITKHENTDRSSGVPGKLINVWSVLLGWELTVHTQSTAC